MDALIAEQERERNKRYKSKAANYNSVTSEPLSLKEIEQVKSKSIFAGRSGIYEEHRQMLI